MCPFWILSVITMAAALTSIDSVQNDATSVLLGTVKVFDQFDDEVDDMIYTGGYLLFECHVKQCQSSHQTVGLSGPNGWTVSTPCDNTVVLRLDITESTLFGKYHCIYGSDRSKEDFELRYRVCSPLDAACSEMCRDDGDEYCMIFGPEQWRESCIINEDKQFWGLIMCRSRRPTDTSPDRVVYCGAETRSECDCPQPWSLCRAHSEGKLRFILARVFDPTVTTSCYVEGSKPATPLSKRPLAYPVLAFTNTVDRYNKIITPSEVGSFAFALIPHHYVILDVTMNCTLKAAAGGTIVWFQAVRLVDNAAVACELDKCLLRADFLQDLLKDTSIFSRDKGLGIYKLECNFRNKGGFILADTSLLLTADQGRALIKANMTIDGQYTNSLVCEPLIPLPPRFVINKYMWAAIDKTKLDEDGPEFVPKSNGTYRCMILITARCRKQDNRIGKLWIDAHGWIDVDAHLDSDEVKVVLAPQEPIATSDGVVVLTYPIVRLMLALILSA